MISIHCIKVIFIFIHNCKQPVAALPAFFFFFSHLVTAVLLSLRSTSNPIRFCHSTLIWYPYDREQPPFPPFDYQETPRLHARRGAHITHAHAHAHPETTEADRPQPPSWQTRMYPSFPEPTPVYHQTPFPLWCIFMKPRQNLGEVKMGRSVPFVCPIPPECVMLSSRV